MPGHPKSQCTRLSAGLILYCGICVIINSTTGPGVQSKNSELIFLKNSNTHQISSCFLYSICSIYFSLLIAFLKNKKSASARHCNLHLSYSSWINVISHQVIVNLGWVHMHFQTDFVMVNLLSWLHAPITWCQYALNVCSATDLSTDIYIKLTKKHSHVHTYLILLTYMGICVVCLPFLLHNCTIIKQLIIWFW